MAFLIRVACPAALQGSPAGTFEVSSACTTATGRAYWPSAAETPRTNGFVWHQVLGAFDLTTYIKERLGLASLPQSTVFFKPAATADDGLTFVGSGTNQDPARTSNTQNVGWILNISTRTRGDVDQGGDVDFADIIVLSKEFGSSGSGLSADFDADAAVDFEDFLVLSTFFDDTVAPAAAVTEPSTFGPMSVGLIGLIGVAGYGRRHRRRKQTVTKL